MGVRSGDTGCGRGRGEEVRGGAVCCTNMIALQWKSMSNNQSDNVEDSGCVLEALTLLNGTTDFVCVCFMYINMCIHALTCL